jgi:hypothetical protein
VSSHGTLLAIVISATRTCLCKGRYIWQQDSSVLVDYNLLP